MNDSLQQIVSNVFNYSTNIGDVRCFVMESQVVLEVSFRYEDDPRVLLEDIEVFDNGEYDKDGERIEGCDDTREQELIRQNFRRAFFYPIKTVENEPMDVSVHTTAIVDLYKKCIEKKK